MPLDEVFFLHHWQSKTPPNRSDLWSFATKDKFLSVLSPCPKLRLKAVLWLLVEEGNNWSR